MAFWNVNLKQPKNLDDWRTPIRQACHWTTERSMMRSVEYAESGAYEHVNRYKDWRGAFRGEYNAATKRWDVYAPTWHGGQGVKGLAYRNPLAPEFAKIISETIAKLKGK